MKTAVLKLADVVEALLAVSTLPKESRTDFQAVIDEARAAAKKRDKGK